METQSENLNILFIIGIAIFAGAVSAKIFHRFRIPQVVGCVVIGLVIGPVLRIIPYEAIQIFDPINLFALGVIGFLVGAELKREIFVKFGKQVPIVLLFEGATAFLLVGSLTFLAMWHFSDWQTALAVGVVFAAICSATDPASTIAVLWEYKARGPLTAMLTAIVTLDDALALTLYAISISVVGIITGHQEAGLLVTFAKTLYEIFGSLFLGAMAGIGLSWLLKRIADPDRMLAFVLSTVLIVLGAAIYLKMDVILAAMALGATLVNLRPKLAQSALKVLHKFFAPIYILFFVLVGARVNFAHVNIVIWVLVAAYVIGSIVGKTLGAYVGGVCSNTVKTVRNYLGFCLYPQGGIAVALLIVASHRFSNDISGLMLLVVIIGAFILQLVGPIGVKYGAGKAGELGLNVTEEDLIKTYNVSNVMERDVPVIAAGDSLNDVLKIISSTAHPCYCVVDDHKEIIGVITLEGIRNIFVAGEMSDWLVALDIAESVVDTVTPDTVLSQAVELMERGNIEYVPVVASRQGKEYAGVLNSQAMHRQLEGEVLSKQREADSMYIHKAV
ncbi:MAG: cation:proton antiporter [Phycisphaerae bacterium]|nr:cation:proton antiporter [Phycisphaerae bacterium]